MSVLRFPALLLLPLPSPPPPPPPSAPPPPQYACLHVLSEFWLLASSFRPPAASLSLRWSSEGTLSGEEEGWLLRRHLVAD